jgi:hypothetical protein
MTNRTIEGIVENGQIRMLENIRLPENTRVYVLVADSEAARSSHLYSPRLAHPEQADDFAKQVEEVPTDGAIMMGVDTIRLRRSPAQRCEILKRALSWRINFF